MPTNLGHEAISALKVGHSNVTAAYAGHQQIFPNTTEIQSAAFTTAGGISNAGGSKILRVTGDIGSAYVLTGSLTGSHTLTSATKDHTLSVGANDSCDDPQRTFTITLTPSGNTIIQGGASNIVNSVIQSAGPVTQTYSSSGSVTMTNTNYVTTTVGGQLRWAPGASWTVSWSYSGTYTTHASIGTFYPGSGSDRGSGSSDSGSFTWTLSTVNTPAVSMRITQYGSGCYDTASISSGDIYP